MPHRYQLTNSKTDALLVQKYKELIVTGHQPQCPWRRRGCDSTIQRLPLLNIPTSINDLQTRYNNILSLTSDLPTNVRLDLDSQQSSTIPDLPSSSADIFPSASTDPWTPRNQTAFLIALYGWQPPSSTPSNPNSIETDVLSCPSCFRRLGLWLYRQKPRPSTTATSIEPQQPAEIEEQDQPTMSHLDPLDSHLDFCPWKSASAQSTELEVGSEKRKFAGWELLVRNVAMEMQRIATKRNVGGNSRPVSRRGEGDDGMEGGADVSQEEREKRSKALMRRIRELKRPFNVKALLKKRSEDEGKT